VTASGGTAPLSYTLNPGAVTNGTGNFTGLTAGVYTVSVSDANACGPVVTGNITISEPAALTVTGTSSTSATCNGTWGGTITVTASGGTAPLSYTLNPGAVTNGTGNFTGWTAGVYTASVSDANACGPVVTGNITINEPAAITITGTSSTDITCNGANDGTITVTASGEIGRASGR